MHRSVVGTIRHYRRTNIARQSCKAVTVTSEVIKFQELASCFESQILNLSTIANTKDWLICLQALNCFVVSCKFEREWTRLSSDCLPTLNLSHIDITENGWNAIYIPLRHIFASIPSLREGLEALASHNTINIIVHLLDYRKGNIRTTRQHRQRNIGATDNTSIARITCKREEIRLCSIAICALLNRNPRWSLHLLNGAYWRTNLKGLCILSLKQNIAVSIVLQLCAILPNTKYTITITVSRCYQMQLTKSRLVVVCLPRDSNLCRSYAIGGSRCTLGCANPSAILNIPHCAFDGLNNGCNRRCLLQRHRI